MAGQRIVHYGWNRGACVRAAACGLTALALGAFAGSRGMVAERVVNDGIRAVPIQNEVKAEARIIRAFVISKVQKGDVLAKLVIDTARKYALPPELVASVVIVESHGDTMAVSRYSKCRARGLMQVRYAVWGEVLRKAGILGGYMDLHDPVKGLEAGAFVLRHYLDKTGGDLNRALALYSGGASKYAKKVREHMARMRGV